MAAHTAAAMVILGIGLLASTPDGLLAWIVRGDDPGATVLRRILPLALVGVPVVAELTLHGQHAGWYQTEVGLAFMVVVASSGVSVVAMHMARVINRSHAAGVLANEQLRELNSSLEARIDERTADLVTERGVGPGARRVSAGRDLPHRRRWTMHLRQRSLVRDLRDARSTTRSAMAGQPESIPRIASGWPRSGTSAIAAGIEFDCEFRVVLPSGEISWVHSHSARVLDAEGAGAGYVGTVSDITARRHAEQALRATEELFRITFGSSPIGMALVDANGLIVRANRALCELTHRPLDELLACASSRSCTPTTSGTTRWVPSAAGVDQRIVRADGSVCWASIRYAQIAQPGEGESGLTIVQFVDTTDRRQSEEHLAHMANTDSLTGLMNRRSLEVALESHVAHCNRYGPTGAVLILDLDNFKRINDSRGHKVGDQVIVTTARLLRQRLRESDLLARLGGDEFAVLITTGDGVAARAVAQSLVEEIRAFAATIAGEQVALSASVGVAVFDDVERSSDEMLVNADIAMYDAKELGRDRWVEFVSKPHDEPRSKARLTWINRIEADIDNDTLRAPRPAHRRPRHLGDRPTRVARQDDRRSGRSRSARQLPLRRRAIWPVEPARRLGPGAGIRPAGSDRWGSRARHSGREPEWHECRRQPPPRRARTARPFGRVRRGATRPASGGTAATSNLAAARAFAERFRELGCRLTFGTSGGDIGSVCYLEHLPFDFIKLDCELVTDCLEDSSSRAVIGSLVDLARSLGKQTIADQVSSDRVRGFLRQRGVDHGQGFHLGLPVPLEEAVPMLSCARTDRSRPAGSQPHADKPSRPARSIRRFDRARGA